MKLTIIAVGSRGDVQPYVALGRGLLEAGYGVRVVTLENFESLVRQLGLEYLPIEGDAQLLTGELMLKMNGNGLNLLRMYRGIMRSFGAISESYSQALSSRALDDTDAILSQLPGGFFGYDLAEHLKVPYIALSVIPQETTGAWPMPLLPSRFSLGALYNRSTYRLGQQLAWQPFRRPINRFRQQLGLPPASFWWGNMRRMVQEAVPVVQGFSEHVVPFPSDWGKHIYTTGYWFLDESDWQPPQALTEFLAAGPKPLFIGFGSMYLGDPVQTTNLLLEALEATGQRAVIGSSWARLGQQTLPSTVCQLDYAPYRWLFPKMAAVIHHGGAGTTGMALGSGVPSLVIPFTADQPYWGERGQVLGVSPAPIPFSKLTAENLAGAIRVMLSDAQMQRRAAELRAAMAEENGVQQAVAVIERLLAH